MLEGCEGTRGPYEAAWLRAVEAADALDCRDVLVVGIPIDDMTRLLGQETARRLDSLGEAGGTDTFLRLSARLEKYHARLPYRMEL